MFSEEEEENNEQKEVESNQNIMNKEANTKFK